MGMVCPHAEVAAASCAHAVPRAPSLHTPPMQLPGVLHAQQRPLFGAATSPRISALQGHRHPWKAGRGALSPARQRRWLWSRAEEAGDSVPADSAEGRAIVARAQAQRASAKEQAAQAAERTQMQAAAADAAQARAEQAQAHAHATPQIAYLDANCAGPAADPEMAEQAESQAAASCRCCMAARAGATYAQARQLDTSAARCGSAAQRRRACPQARARTAGLHSLFGQLETVWVDVPMA